MALVRRSAVAAAAAAYFLALLSSFTHISASTLPCAPWCRGAALSGEPSMLHTAHGALILVTCVLVCVTVGAVWRAGLRDWLVHGAAIALIGAVALTFALALPLGTGAAGVFSVLAHPTAAMSLLGTLLILTTALFNPVVSAAPVGARARRQARRFRALVIAAALASFIVLLTGGAMESGAARGQVHWVVSFAVGLLLGATLWETYRQRRGQAAVVGCAMVAGTLFVVQAAFGAAYLILDRSEVLAQMHVAVAILVWASLVVFAVTALRAPAPAALPVRHPAQTRSPVPTLRFSDVIADYVALTKPRVISLLLLTTAAPMFVAAEGLPDLGLFAWTMLGGYLAAGGANAINMYFDRDIDAIMTRTRKRPVPGNRMAPERALRFGVALGVLSFVIFALFVNVLSGVLAIAGLAFYVFVYTGLLKRSTPQNIVIGGAAGAFPPLVGWAAVTNSVGLLAVWLFIIVFYWTPPHFWALALMRKSDYANAGVPMLPVVYGDAETRRQIMLYSLLLIVLTMVLVPFGFMGWIYLAAAVGLALVWMHYAWRVWRNEGPEAVWGLYKYSLLYLALLFVAMAVDRIVL